VVASDASSIPEVCGGAALLVPPGNTEAVSQALGRVLTDQETRNRLVAAGLERAKEFSWERTAKLTRDAYEAAARDAGRQVSGSGKRRSPSS
jgi:glycosyltransferase involved in cell wall biosynthesis